MILRGEFNFEPERQHIDARLWMRGRPGMWIARTVWGRKWARRPDGWRPFQRDVGGYCKWGRFGGWAGPGVQFAVGRFAVIVYRPPASGGRR